MKPGALLTAIASVFILAGQLFAGDIRLLKNEEYFNALDEKVRAAREEILVAVYLFRTVESKKNLATRLREDLIGAAGRGVKVTVLLEKEKGKRKGSTLNDDNAYTAGKLSGGGVKVVFDGIETTTHTKMMVIDRRFVFIGSHNLSDSALRWNNEASVIIDSPPMAKEAASFIRDMQ